ncbi:uncharacterized protein LOC135216809 [Macrobrachium nipponense]|uniref:uncharacterized protein LOC135216809 n=1 Tax=Macrobrachium nipponense TaxID=159736 RepID=UPI0030C81CD1
MNKMNMNSVWVVVALTLSGIQQSFAPPVQRAPSFLESGKCASFSLIDNFQVHRYLGRWYHTWGVPSAYVKAQRCAVDTITLPGSKMKVVTTGFTSGGSRARTQAKLNYVKPKRDHKKPYMQLEATSVPAVPYVIMDTDYTSYSCIFSCYNIIGLKVELYWIYSRTPELPPKAQQKCFSLFESKGLNLTRMVKNNHDGCNHSPVNLLHNDTDITNGFLLDSESELGQVGYDDDDDVHEARVQATYSDDEDDTEGEEGSGDSPHWSSSSRDSHHRHHHGHKDRMSTALEEAILIEEGKTANTAFVDTKKVDGSTVPEGKPSSGKEPDHSRKHVHDAPGNSSSSLTSESLLVTFMAMVFLSCLREGC